MMVVQMKLEKGSVARIVFPLAGSAMLLSPVPMLEYFAAATEQPSPGDTSAEDLLIDKFAAVRAKLSSSDPSKVPVTLRLADLLSERARKSSQHQIEFPTQLHPTQHQNDRARAIDLYLSVVDSAPADNQARIYLQVAHLYELNGEVDKAISSYEKLPALKVVGEAQLAEAEFARAEIYLRGRQLARARPLYQRLINGARPDLQGLAAHRLAWVDFHESRFKEAVEELVNILRSPRLLRRGTGAPSGESSGPDAQFQEEVSRDLATFMVKRGIQPDDRATLYELSPASCRIENLRTLAGEAERLGQSENALSIWRFLGEQQKGELDRCESWVHVARLEMASQKNSESLAAYRQAASAWERNGSCREERRCQDLRQLQKNFLLEWNSAQKENPSAELISAYEVYHRQFPSDDLMTIQMAQAARLRRDFARAFASLVEAAQNPGEHQEQALLAAIEIAEVAKNTNWLKQALELYVGKSDGAASDCGGAEGTDLGGGAEAW
ncbi:MAG: hypothetical protein C5B49_07980, partial [Bdellovibrio sp.]